VYDIIIVYERKESHENIKIPFIQFFANTCFHPHTFTIYLIFMSIRSGMGDEKSKTAFKTAEAGLEN
jgi:hypothetical protein